MRTDGAAGAAGQSGSRFDSPEAAFRAAADAIAREDWHGVAGTCDPVSLAAFRRQLVAQFDRTESPGVLTVDEYLRHYPEMPRAVAEYHVEQHKAQSDPVRQLRRELPDAEDVAHLKRLGPEEVFALWLAGRSPRREVERMLAEQGIDPGSAASMLEQLTPSFAYEPVGAVADGERVAHVLYRMGGVHSEDDGPEAAAWLAGLPVEERELTRELAGRQHPMVATCRRQPDGSWRLIADHGFLRLGSFGICVTPEPADEPKDDAR